MGMFDVQLTPQILYQQVVDSIVYIENLTDTGNILYGSGVVISRGGVILTAAHILAGASLISVEFSNGKKYTVSKTSPWDEGRDLATVKIDNPGQYFSPIFMRDLKAYPLSIGSKLFAIGHPFKQKFSYTEGIVSQLRKEFLVPGKYIIHNAIQTSAELNPGNSGCPCFDIKGRMVSMSNCIVGGCTDTGVTMTTSTDDIVQFLGGH